MEDFDKLLAKVKKYKPKADLELIKKAFKFAHEAHVSHKRLSGDPYITHPLAVAHVLAEIKQDEQVLAAALLHDVVEDADVTNQELAQLFGKEVAHLVEGVTKLSQFSFISREVQQAENFRKMFVAMGEDFRIILIKLADRLHNMQTLQYLPPAKQKATSLETREIFAPLAHRLGMWRLKWELEDYAFFYLEPDKYEEIKSKVAESRTGREDYIQKFIQEVTAMLKKVNIECRIYGRPKHFYSIYHKMVDQNIDFDEIYDLTAVRIIVKSVKECYAVLGVAHAAWKPIPGRFRDYIAMPKSNGYQSLHTTLIGSRGRPVEVQIRTEEMHAISEHGIAAHWRYKEGPTDEKLDKRMSWFREMMEWQHELKDAKDFMDSLKVGLFDDEVFVFTPKGDVYSLPIDATPIDFAYRVHTEVGHRSIGARVNGRIVPLNHELSSGNIVEILTGKKDNPSRDWLRFVKTPGARVKIRNWFKKHKIIIKPEESISVPAPKKQVVPALGKTRKKSKSGVKVTGLSNVLIKISKCCNPIPGDKITGYVTQGRGIAIHRSKCKNVKIEKIAKDKFVPVEWEVNKDLFYSVELYIEAFDRVGIFKDILGQVAETKTNVSAAKVTTKRGSSAMVKLSVDVKDVKHLNQVIIAIQKVSDVYNVHR